MDGSRAAGFAQVSVPDGYGRFLLVQLFEPWAAELITCAEFRPGCCVLDVASGLGPVARLAAAVAGPAGRVAIRVGADRVPALSGVGDHGR